MTPLKFLHSEMNRVKIEVFRRLSSTELCASLAPGRPGSLKASPDGTVLDGHHRVTVLLERGVNIHELPREIMEKDE